MKKVKIFSVLLFTLFLTSVSINTYALTFGYTLNGGVGNYGYNKRYYYIDSSASNYSSYINDAVYDWTYTSVTTPISIKNTTTKSSSVFDLYCTSFSGDTSTIGETQYYLYNDAVYDPYVGPTQNYGWTQIILNSNVFPTLPAKWGLTSDQQKKATVAHEFGHAMGLKHDLSTTSIMCQYGGGRSVEKAQTYNLNDINDLY